MLVWENAGRVTAQFRCNGCSSRWSSVQARFDPQEERVLGQKCKCCEVQGAILNWQFSEPDFEQKPDGERKHHRTDLCEACSKFGNCQGAFFEPFIMSSAIEMVASKPRWYSCGSALVAQAGSFFVTLLPHVVSPGQAEHTLDLSPQPRKGHGRSFGKGRGKGRGKHK